MTNVPHFLLFLSTLVTLGTLISYRAILSYEAADSYIADLSNAPPPLRGYHGVVSSTAAVHDAPQGKFSPPERVAYNDDDGHDGSMLSAYMRPPPPVGGLGSAYSTGNDDDDDDGNDVKVQEDDKDEDEDDDDVDVDDDDDEGSEGQTYDQESILKAQQKSVMLKNFRADDPPKDVLAVSATRQSKIDFDSIAQQWELPQSSIGLLKQIHSRTVAFDYNRTTDILSLRHPLKTGGTSFSRMLEEIFEGRTIPGSGFSNWFQHAKFKKALEEHDTPGDPYWTNMAAFYTHSFLRPSQGGRKNKLLEELREAIPALREKRFRLMTIVRRPLDLAASSFYETQCRIGTHANQRNIKHVKDCPAVNLTDVMQKNIDHWTVQCDPSNKDMQKQRCAKMQERGLDKVFEHCGSIEKLFEKGFIHNMMYKSLMGDFPRPPELGDDNDLVGENLTPTLQDVATYTLRDLGGLIDYSPDYKEDFIWFAVTERFKESMCLFYYRFEIEPVAEKHSLFKPCRPLSFWTEQQKKTHIQNEGFDYSVWKAANAILDVRMEDMRLEIDDRIAAGEKLEDIPYVGPGCYEAKPQRTAKGSR